MTFLGPFCSASLVAPETEQAVAPRIEVVGKWQVRVLPGGKGNQRVTRAAILTVPPATHVYVRDEKYDALPLFDANAAPWNSGAKLRQLTTFETTAADMLVPESLVVKAGPGDAVRFSSGKDYALEPQWATFGRLPGGIPEGQPVWANYECGWGRLDSLVVDKKGIVKLLPGTAHNATPVPPTPGKDSWTLANLWIPGHLPKLTRDNLYPILEPEYPTPKRSSLPPAASLLSKTWAKLQKGEPLHILAWGDSVTAGGTGQ